MLITVCALFLSTAADTRFLKTLPPVVLSVMISNYVFYLFDRLHTGKILTSIGMFVLCCALLWRFISKKELLQRLRKNVASKPFLIYCIFVCLAFVLTLNKYVFYSDSLRLWGAYPKALVTFETRQLGEDSLLFPIMQSYLPGMPLLSYFMSGFSKTFYEHTVFFTYDYFYLVFLLPLVDNVMERRTVPAGGKSQKAVDLARTVLFAVVATVLIPWIFYRNYGTYIGLFIDPALGILAGYHFTNCFNQFGLKKFSFITTLLSGVGLVLLKDSGLLFAAVGVVGAIFCRIACNRNALKRTLCYSAGVLLCLVAAWYSWSAMIASYSVSNHLSLKIFMPTGSNMKQIMRVVFIEAIAELELKALQIHFTLPAFLFVMFAVKLILAYSSSKRLKREIAESVVMLVTCALFLAGYYFIFYFSINEGGCNSYGRYMGTIILMYLYIVGYDATAKYFDLINRGKAAIRASLGGTAAGERLMKSVRLVSLTLVIGFTIASVTYISMFLSKEKKTDSDYIRGGEIADILIRVAGENDGLTDVYLCMPGNPGPNTRTHLYAYFSLIDDRIRVRNYSKETNITSTGLGFTPERFLDELIQKDYEYVMFTRIDENLLNEFQTILGDAAEGENDVVYRVNKEGRSLERVRY